TPLLFHLSPPAHRPHLPSFPTRRSSDLRRPSPRRWSTRTRSPPSPTSSSPTSPMAVHSTWPARWVQSVASPCATAIRRPRQSGRSEEHTSELQSLTNLVCRLLLEKKKKH